MVTTSALYMDKLFPAAANVSVPRSILRLNVAIFPLTTYRNPVVVITTVKGDKNNFNVAVKFNLLFKNQEWTAIASQIITCMETRRPVTC